MFKSEKYFFINDISLSQFNILELSLDEFKILIIDKIYNNNYKEQEIILIFNQINNFLSVWYNTEVSYLFSVVASFIWFYAIIFSSMFHFFWNYLDNVIYFVLLGILSLTLFYIFKINKYKTMLKNKLIFLNSFILNVMINKRKFMLK